MWNLLIGPVSDLLNTVLKRVLPAEKMSEEEREKLSAAVLLEMSKLDFSALEGQLKINLEEAKSQSLFVAGWRPFIGWVCGSALAYHFILQPLLAFTITLFRWQTPPLPAFSMESLMTILLGLLGLGGMRTFEKIKGGAVEQSVRNTAPAVPALSSRGADVTSSSMAVRTPSVQHSGRDADVSAP